MHRERKSLWRCLSRFWRFLSSQFVSRVSHRSCLTEWWWILFKHQSSTFRNAKLSNLHDSQQFTFREYQYMACGRCVRKTQKTENVVISHVLYEYMWKFQKAMMNFRQHENENKTTFEQHIIVSVQTLRSHRYENKWKFVCNITEEIIELSPENWYWTRGEKLCDDGDGKKEKIIKLSFQAFWGVKMNVIIEQLCQELWRKDFIVFRQGAHNLANAIFFSLFNVTLSDNFCRLFDSTRENYITSPPISSTLSRVDCARLSRVCTCSRLDGETSDSNEVVHMRA